MFSWPQGHFEPSFDPGHTPYLFFLTHKLVLCRGLAEAEARSKEKSSQKSCGTAELQNDSTVRVLTLHITQFNVWQWNHFIFAPLPPCQGPGTSVHASCCSNSQTTRRIFSSIWQVPVHPQRLDSSGEMFGRVSQYLSNAWCFVRVEEAILFFPFFFTFCLHLIADGVDTDLKRGERERGGHNLQQRGLARTKPRMPRPYGMHPEHLTTRTPPQLGFLKRGFSFCYSEPHTFKWPGRGKWHLVGIRSKWQVK